MGWAALIVFKGLLSGISIDQDDDQEDPQDTKYRPEPHASAQPSIHVPSRLIHHGFPCLPFGRSAVFEMGYVPNEANIRISHQTNGEAFNGGLRPARTDLESLMFTPIYGVTEHQSSHYINSFITNV